MIAQGLSDREIAHRLVLSVRTVNGHVQRILTKLGMTSRTSVATWFVSAERVGQPGIKTGT